MKELKAGDWVEFIGYRKIDTIEGDTERTLFELGRYYQVHNVDEDNSDLQVNGILNPLTQDSDPGRLWWLDFPQVRKVDEFVVKLKEITDENSNDG